MKCDKCGSTMREGGILSIYHSCPKCDWGEVPKVKSVFVYDSKEIERRLKLKMLPPAVVDALQKISDEIRDQFNRHYGSSPDIKIKPEDVFDLKTGSVFEPPDIEELAEREHKEWQSQKQEMVGDRVWVLIGSSVLQGVRQFPTRVPRCPSGGWLAPSVFTIERDKYRGYVEALVDRSSLIPHPRHGSILQQEAIVWKVR